MLTKERFFRILELLDHKSFITIQELMEVLNASKSTVNRDLIELEKQGLIQRERGGAIKKECLRHSAVIGSCPLWIKNIFTVHKRI